MTVLVHLQVINCCAEHVINDVGPEIFYDETRDEQQEALLVDALNKWPTDKNYAFCVVCGLSICSDCMGNKYFPNTILTDNTPRRKHFTGFQVKAVPLHRYFVCHDCADDKDRYACLLLPCCMLLLFLSCCAHVQVEVGLDHPQLAEAVACAQ